jgi:hypothetical protein
VPGKLHAQRLITSLLCAQMGCCSSRAPTAGARTTWPLHSVTDAAHGERTPLNWLRFPYAFEIWCACSTWRADSPELAEIYLYAFESGSAGSIVRGGRYGRYVAVQRQLRAAAASSSRTSCAAPTSGQGLVMRPVPPSHHQGLIPTEIPDLTEIFLRF